MSERKCADCGTDISSRHYNAKLCLDCYYKRNNYNSSMKKQIAAFETRNAQEIAKLRLQLDQAKAFAGRQTLRLATMTEKRDRLELLRRTHGAAADAMAIARDEAQAEAIRLRSALANIVQAAAE